MLDTDICVYLIKRKPRHVLESLHRMPPSGVGLSSITLSELEYGVSKSQRPEQNRIALLQFVIPLEVLPYDDRAATEYGRIRTHLEMQGTPIGALDTLIAAHALSLNTVLITNNLSEFERVPGLKTDNWADRPPS